MPGSARQRAAVPPSPGRGGPSGGPRRAGRGTAAWPLYRCTAAACAARRPVWGPGSFRTAVRVPRVGFGRGFGAFLRRGRCRAAAPSGRRPARRRAPGRSARAPRPRGGCRRGSRSHAGGVLGGPRCSSAAGRGLSGRRPPHTPRPEGWSPPVPRLGGAPRRPAVPAVPRSCCRRVAGRAPSAAARPRRGQPWEAVRP